MSIGGLFRSWAAHGPPDYSVDGVQRPKDSLRLIWDQTPQSVSHQSENSIIHLGLLQAHLPQPSERVTERASAVSLHACSHEAHLPVKDKCNLRGLAPRMASQSHCRIPFPTSLRRRVSGAMQAALSWGRLARSSTGCRTAQSTTPQKTSHARVCSSPP